jgi:hypothetical protein
MNGRLRRNTWLALSLAVITAIGIGIGAYNLGVAHGLAEAGRASGATASYPYWAYRPWGFGFGFFPFLFIFLWFLLFRGLFWRSWRGHYWYGPHQVPPGLEEWHRRAHENMKSDALGPPSVSS